MKRTSKQHASGRIQRGRGPLNSWVGSAITYRPEIDGLRAVAVLSVILFHAGLGLPGGFVGVDVFFVISGFLITSILLRELGQDRFSFPTFWERRARRILPASAVMVAATLVAGWFFLLPADYRSLANSVALQSVFSSNLYFWQTTNYFASEDAEPPLLHTWSLAIEEQYYFFFPVVLLVACRWASARRAVSVTGILLAGIATSLAICVWFLPRSPSGTFYLLPSRAWELLIGSTLATLPACGTGVTRVWREGFAWLGLALIAGPCVIYSDHTPFPGWYAVPPCLGAALFIWATTRPGTAAAPAPPVSAARLLSLPPVVFTGRISYSLYLWHWPLFAFASILTLGLVSGWTRALLVAVSFGLAAASWAMVESPFRSRRFAPTGRSMALWSLAFLGVPGGLALVILFRGGVPSRFSDRLVVMEEARVIDADSLPALRASTLSDATSGRFPQLGLLETSQPDIIVWGDSHARSIVPALEQLAAEHHKSIVSAWFSSTPPVLGYTPQRRLFSLRRDAVPFNQAVFDFIRDRKIPDVILAARWSAYLPATNPSSTSDGDKFSRLFLETVAALRALPTRVWILAEVPTHHVNVPKALIHREWLGRDPDPFRSDRASHQRFTAPFANLRPHFEGPGVVVVDVQDRLLDPADGRFLMEFEGQPLYSDSNHLTPHVVPLLKPALLPIFEH